MHDVAVPVGDSDQVTDLHLAEPQWHVAAADLAAGLDDAGGLADATVADDAGGEVGFGQDLPQDGFHLFDVHFLLAL